MDWMFLSFQNSYIEILPLDMMVFESGAIDPVYEGRAFRNKISVLIIVTPESSILLSAMWGNHEEMFIWDPELLTMLALYLGLPVSKIYEFLLFTSHAIYGILL